MRDCCLSIEGSSFFYYSYFPFIHQLWKSVACLCVLFYLSKWSLESVFDIYSILQKRKLFQYMYWWWQEQQLLLLLKTRVRNPNVYIKKTRRSRSDDETASFFQGFNLEWIQIHCSDSIYFPRNQHLVSSLLMSRKCLSRNFQQVETRSFEDHRMPAR